LGQGPQRIIFSALEGRKTKLLAELSRVAYKGTVHILFISKLTYLVLYFLILLYTPPASVSEGVFSQINEDLID